jgi:hypothetical protein
VTPTRGQLAGTDALNRRSARRTGLRYRPPHPARPDRISIGRPGADVLQPIIAAEKSQLHQPCAVRPDFVGVVISPEGKPLAVGRPQGGVIPRLGVWHPGRIRAVGLGHAQAVSLVLPGQATVHGPGDHILDLIPRAGVTDLRTLGLNERQIEALRLMVNEGRELSNKEYRERFGVTSVTAFRDLTQLVELGLARAEGAGRGRKYVRA